MMEFSKVKLVVFAPNENADAVRQALGAAGAGVIGAYSFCSYSSAGIGRFIPGQSAKPHIGEKNELTTVMEHRIEVVCDRAKAKSVLAAMKKVHPYEEVAFDIYPLIEEAQL